ncbi:ROK family protein [Brevibacterium sp. 5221]|uniref:ROK family protein n=1 Tax=Brevibacterium rongguiense TaxID=2695267 RepID=A0A6N9H4X9_9MICO|nr:MULTISPECIES: ROK family protein [Brevibacterium]MYM18995.1 ROK family protein [Brevibacterium rongguiense]WAL40714.1 ROK family protein [Brevibacterium sp. BRM-1]
MSSKTHTSWAIGIDIGGTGIKVGLVDTATGSLPFKRVRVLTPKPATPEAVISEVAGAVDQLLEKAVRKAAIGHADEVADVPLGVAFPGVIKDDTVSFCPNLDQSWLGESLGAAIQERTGRVCYSLNDADAAGFAEMAFGAGRDWRHGVVLVTTLGTGIGTALFTSGHLVPYTELGHLEIDGHDAETRAAESVKVREGLDYPTWAARLQRYYEELEKLFTPDVFIVGGGVSKSHEEFLPLLRLHTPIVPAHLLNDAGVVGAAALAANAGKAKVKKK